MKPQIFNLTKCLFFAFLLFCFFAFGLPVQAEETSTSTSAVAGESSPSTPSTPPIQDETPTSTLPISDSDNQTTTTTDDIAEQYNNQVAVDYIGENIFAGDVLTTSTWFYDSSGTLFSSSTISALGVLAEASRQGNFPLTIQSGWGYYVSSIGGHDAQGFDGWIYNINQQDPGWIGMNDYQIHNNDMLTVFYSVWPWKIESNTSTVHLGENVTFKALNYASSTWQASPSTTISINNQLFATDDNGQYVYTPIATGTLSAFIYGSETWSQNSPTISVMVLEPAPTSTSATTTDNNTNGNNNSGGNSNSNNNPAPIPQSELNDVAQKILNYLKSQQLTDGKIIDGTITDWAIMSFSANGQYADEIKIDNKSLLDFAKDYNFTDSSDLNKCAGYPRHILALLAGGIDAKDSLIQNLTNKIRTDCYQSNLYGQNGINDDIFGLIALLAVGSDPNEPIIQDIVHTILTDQQADGAFTWAGWPGADITGAAMNVLKYAESKGIVIEQNLYSKAKTYLKNNQLNDGGWGYGATDALTTSWVLMGINAIGQSQSDWFNSQGKNPWHPLMNQLKTVGYYESSWAPGTVDWFATKHAVPALLGKSWPIILAPKTQQTAESGSSNYGSVSPPPIPTTTSTPIIIATTTLFATSTPELSATTTLIVETPISTLTIISQITNYQLPITKQIQNPNKQMINTTTIQQFNNLTIEQHNNFITSTSPSFVISATPTSTRPITASKAVFGISLTAASGLGLYLAWRLLQTVV